MRRARLACTVAFAGACGSLLLVLLVASPGAGQSVPRDGIALPQLGVADSEMKLIGAVPDGEPGETWGYRMLPAETPAPTVAGQRLAFGAQTPGRDTQQLAFLRLTDATGWQIAATPVDADGEPYRGPVPNPVSATMTPRGGALLIGRDPARAGGDPLVVIMREPGDRWQERRLPTGRLPADPDALLAVGEALGTDGGAGRVASVAYDTAAAGTGAFVGIVGPAVEQAIAHHDGTAWRREQIVLPPGVAEARIVAVDATAPDNAWALVETDGTRGVELYRRAAGPSGARWIRQPLGSGRFDERDTPAEGISQVAPLRDNADPVTVTADGLWIDLSLRATGAAASADPPGYDVTLFFRPIPGGGLIAASWCDAPDRSGAPLCDHPLGVSFGRGPGYRSFAWTGGPDRFGTRIVTNPTEPGRDQSTNRGSYLRFEGQNFQRMLGAGGNALASGAFASADRGWLEGPTQIGGAAPPDRLRRWPVALRAPLVDAVAAPGAPAGALDAGALAAGANGAVARFVPDQGWVREFLLSPSGSVARPRLRGVAWPEAGRAHAVGDGGAMWLWRADTALWERDPAAPIGFEGHLMDIAFDPGNPDRGYAVGRAGVLLRYDKTWTQDDLPAAVQGRDITSVTFAGGQALAVAGADLLVNDGGGWRVDAGVAERLGEIRAGTPYLRVAAGLADGGAVVGGRGFVLERDEPGRPWRFADQPLPAQTVVAAAAFRAGDRVRALVAVQPRLRFPSIDDPVQQDPDVPPPILPPQPLPGDGYLLRETDSGWRDEQRTAFGPSTVDRPLKSDPIAAFVIGPGGDGWALGGWSGEPDFAGRGTRLSDDRTRVQTAAVLRYDPGGAPAAARGFVSQPVTLAPRIARFAVAGHAQCESACADLAGQGIAPDRMLSSALALARDLSSRPAGPRLFVNTGGRTRPGPGAAHSPAEAQRYAGLLSSAPGLGVFSAVSEGEARGGIGPFRAALASAPAPAGDASAPPGLTPSVIPGAAAPAPGARTHYALDSSGPEGTLRVVVIDNSLGSLAASDPHQNPAEPQLAWLRAALDDARARGIAVVVVGSRDLSRFTPRLNAAGDGDEVARALVQGGASAYFYDRPEENRMVRIPSGAQRTIPAFGTGTLGYRSPLRVAAGQDVALSLFGDRMLLLAEVDLAAHDRATNVAPVSVRGLPIIDDLSLQAIDGTLLRRSRPSLFQGLGRRPLAGDRWGEPAGDAGPDPPGGDPYTVFPPEQCLIAGCDTRIQPEFRFSSSDPDIADFVRQDPESPNLRKPFIGQGDKVVSDASSALLCPFNAGTTTVTVQAGGLSFSQRITVLAGSVQRPCGTRPLNPSRFTTVSPAQRPLASPAEPPPAPPPPPNPPVPIPVAPLPAAVTPPFAAKPPTLQQPLVQPLDPLPPALTAIRVGPPVTPLPPPAAGFAQPIPPSGATVRVLEEKREEEVAPEQSQAFSRARVGERLPLGEITIGTVLLLALAGAAVARPRRRDRRLQIATAAAQHEHGARRRPQSFGEPTGRRQR